jgi:hypothetical protein
MIRILVSAPAPTGFFPYKIEGHWGPGGAPLIGIAEDPIAEACRVLQALGVDPDTRVKVEAPQTRLGPIRASWLLRHLGDVKMLPRPQKALPALRRARRKALVARGSGVPGDG